MSRFSNDARNSTKLRKDFDGILREYGHNIYLQRGVLIDGQRTYPAANQLEIHTVRFSVTANRALPGIGQEMEEGLVNTSERIYYFRHNADPFEGDRVYELEPRPLKHQTVWEIDGAIPMYGVGGNLVYWVTGATRIRPN